MKTTRLYSIIASGLAFCLVLNLAGCGNNSTNTETASASSASTDPSSAALKTSSTTASAMEATMSVVENGVGTEPAQSVAIFLDSMRRGDEVVQHSMLTTLARTELAKSEWVLHPLGSPEGRYDIGRVVFPYDDKTISLVECVWTEPPQAGETAMLNLDFVFEVRQEADGWRISGLGVTEPGMTDTLVIDFEDAQSLNSTLNAAQAPKASSDGQAASNVAAQPNFQPADMNSLQLPSVPSFGGSENQIALPPSLQPTLR
ncbi:MAG: hypothetical protein KDB03_18435 [Planctomycetales bacterium]|nr:hypothetical protein [Planctomycetales bacterium]